MDSVPHEEKQAVHDAAEWLSRIDHTWRPRPIIPAVCEQFGLSYSEACQAIREASLIRARAH